MNETNSRQVPIEVDTVGDKQTFTIHANYSDKNFDAMKNEDINSEEFPSQFQPMEQINNVHQDLVPIGNIEATTCSPELILGDKQVIIWDELCRVCATSNEKLISIFGTEGSEYELETKIREYLPRLRLSQDDSLPLKVCYNCVSILVGWHDIYSKCDQAQERLLELHRELHPEDQPLHSTTSEEISLNNQENHSIDTKDEVQCDPNLIAVLSDNNVAASENKSTKKKQRRARIVKEFRKVYVPGMPTVNDDEPEPPTKKKRAAKANSTDASPAKKRKKTLVDKSSKKSDKAATSKRKPKDSVKPSGDEDKPKNVNDEKSTLPSLDLDDSSDDFPENRKKKRVNRTCPDCGKKFRLEESYEMHLRVHQGKLPYICNQCDKQFSQNGSLYYHVRHVHGGVKNHVCDICGRCFAMKTALQDHRRIHTGERPFFCENCGKSFKTKASLYIHGKLHTDEFPFKCSYCNKAFRWKQQMISHVTTHTGEKNHICEICGKGFGVKNELTRHILTHSTEKPFKCETCDISFGQQRYLTNHNRTKHKIKQTDNESLTLLS